MTAVVDRPDDAVRTTPAPAPVTAPREPRRRTRSRTRDDDLTLVAAVVAALATTWVLYERVLPFSGRVGFVVCAYAVFIAFYAGLTALSRPRHVVVDRVVTTLVIGAPTLVGAALASTVIFTLVKGIHPLLHANFYTEDMSGVRGQDGFDHGGILHAMTGTLIEVTIAVAIALPLGVVSAVYMAEVGGRFSRIVRTVVEGMTALPSVVAGLFVYATLRVELGLPASGFAAAVALSVMGLPIMARTADVVLRIVPDGLREASYALGAGRWQTVWKVVLPTARPGLATALILGIARMVGETSPLLLTSGGSTFLNTDPFHDPMNSLPLFIFYSVGSGEPRLEERGFAAAIVLLVIVLSLFLLARLFARQRKVR